MEKPRHAPLHGLRVAAKRNEAVLRRRSQGQIDYDEGMTRFTVKDLFRWTFFIALGIGVYRTQPWPLWIYWITPIASLFMLIGYHQVPLILELSGLAQAAEVPGLKSFLFAAVAICGLLTGLPGLVAGIFLKRSDILVLSICSTTIGLVALLVHARCKAHD
jgi:hypothetical protein